MGDSIFNYYNAIFNPIDLIHKHSYIKKSTSHPDYVTNFLGIKIPPNVHPDLLTKMKGVVKPPPLPAN
ncbi:MAG: hypothetical protein C0174_00810 [Thermodesulfobium narugense]|nr:MAG: hypothetical protein C0174_00810 [Thermodesulfobium narugense]